MECESWERVSGERAECVSGVRLEESGVCEWRKSGKRVEWGESGERVECERGELVSRERAEWGESGV